jgi:hypothetical protein
MRPDAVGGQMEVEHLRYHQKRFYSIGGNVLGMLGGKIPPIARFLYSIRKRNGFLDAVHLVVGAAPPL